MATSWWQRLFTKRISKPAGTGKKRGSTRPMLLEALEDRFMPATIFVHATADGAPSALHPIVGQPGKFTADNLRSAVAHYNDFTGASSIVLDAGKTFSLTLGQLNITYTDATALTIKSSTSKLAVIDANLTSRIFEVHGDGITKMDHLELKNGNAPDSPDDDTYGGAIRVDGDGNLTLTNDLLDHNHATGYGGRFPRKGLGGAVFTEGELTVTNTTFDQNTAQGGDRSSGFGNAGGAEGGAICAGFNAGKVSITASTFSNNQAIGGANLAFAGSEGGSGGNAYGGAIEIVQQEQIHLKISNSTFAFNTAQGGTGYGGGFDSNLGTTGGSAYGGAIANGASFDSSGGQNTVQLVNDTIAFNHVFGGEGSDTGLSGSANGGGVANLGANTAFSSVNTIIAKNTVSSPTGPTFGPDIFGDFHSLGHNLIGDGSDGTGFSAATHDKVGTNVKPIDPLLGPLQNNGGPTKTMALKAGSPAIDAGDDTFAGLGLLTYDQRGPFFFRKSGLHVDIGAFEVQSARGRLLVHVP